MLDVVGKLVEVVGEFVDLLSEAADVALQFVGVVGLVCDVFIGAYELVVNDINNPKRQKYHSGEYYNPAYR